MTKKWGRDSGDSRITDEPGVGTSATDAASTFTDDGGRSDYGNAPSLDTDRSSLPNNNEGEEAKESSLSSWPVALYIPNLLGYLRITLSFYGLKHALQQNIHNALNIWIAAALLDLIDGMIARKLNQSSQFGVLLDIMADNILRTIIWMSAVVESSKSDPTRESEICIWAAMIICLEWTTMFCSQNNQKNKSGDDHAHWKDVQRKSAETERKISPPFWVRAVFKNNFRSLPGIFAIYGLFVAPIGTYVWYADRVHQTTWPSRLLSERNVSMLIKISYAGRFLSAMVELWLCYAYLSNVITRDTANLRKQKGS